MQCTPEGKKAPSELNEQLQQEFSAPNQLLLKKSNKLLRDHHTENQFNFQLVSHEQVLKWLLLQVRSPSSITYISPIASHLASPLTHIINAGIAGSAANSLEYLRTVDGKTDCGIHRRLWHSSKKTASTNNPRQVSGNTIQLKHSDVKRDDIKGAMKLP